MNKKQRQGQSTLEYILLVTGVLIVLIALVAGRGGVFQTKLNATLSQPMGFMNTFANKLNPN